MDRRTACPRFYTVVSLGREVCGFPRIVHGGLTAAIIDESFGGLLFSLKKSRALNFWGPAYTVGGLRPGAAARPNRAASVYSA